MKRSRFNVIHYRIVFTCICDEYEAFLEFLYAKHRANQINNCENTRESKRNT